MSPIEDRTTRFDRRSAPIETNRRLRIGYVSSDLRHHAVGYLMVNFFEEHDRKDFEVFAYYTGIKADDPIQARIKASVDHWRDIRGITDDEAAAKIADDGIDILVDVNGHTRDARLGVFARRPAPIQVNWLGYPGTMGSSFHQYIVADDWTIPEHAEAWYSERVLRLPCYQPNDRKRIIDETVPTRADFGLPDNAFVFCCFNASHKFTRFNFDRWMDILKQSDNSVLWLLDYTPETNQRLREASRGARRFRRSSVLCAETSQPAPPRALSAGRPVPRQRALWRPHHGLRCAVDGRAGAHLVWPLLCQPRLRQPAALSWPAGNGLRDAGSLRITRHPSCRRGQGRT